jgi:hypothetical protein
MSFQNKFDNLIKDFCKEIASTYPEVDEKELFSLWKGVVSKEDPPKPKVVQTTLQPKVTSSVSSSTSSIASSTPSTSSTSSNDDSDLDITKEKILVANKEVLSAMCKKKGLKMSGKKEELVQRLIETLSSSSSTSKESSSSSSSSSSFTSSSSSKKSDEPSVIKALKSTVSDIAIRKNKYGNFEHMQTGLVFNTDKMVYGRQVGEEVLSLTTEDIETCKKYKFIYKLPDNLNMNKNLDDIKIDDVEEEDDLEDEELVEDVEDDEDEIIDDDEKA